MGTSPHVWEDTLIENLFVNDCLSQGQCTSIGARATVGIVHSAGYLHWRTLLAWLGVGADGTYLHLLVMNALGVCLAALVARRLGGRLAAALTAPLMVACMGLPMQLNVISDLAPMPFLGAVFLLVAQAAFSQRSMKLTALMGAVAGVMTNVYATGCLCGLSAVWVALLIPQRRWRHAAVALGSFAAATFFLSPATWIMNAQILIIGDAAGTGHPARPLDLQDLPLLRLTAVAFVAWLGAAVVSPALRRRLDVPVAVFLPLLAALSAGKWFGRINPQDKYNAHAIAAVAVTVAVTMAAFARWVWRGLSWPVPRDWSSLAARATGGVLPFAAAGLIAAGWAAPQQRVPNRFSFGDLISVRAFLSSPPDWAWATEAEHLKGRDFPDFDYADLAFVEGVLGHDRGWSPSEAWRNLKCIDDTTRRAAVRWPPGWPAGGMEGRRERAYLLKAPTPLVAGIPQPSNVIVAPHAPHNTTLLALGCSWIDWRSFRVCQTGPDGWEASCVASGLPDAGGPHSEYEHGIPGMPPGTGRERPQYKLAIHFPLDATPGCPEESVYMPRVPRICPGRIRSVDGATAGIEDDGRRVTLKGGERELVIDWDIDAFCEYRGSPPFFVEGEPSTVAFVSALLEAQEKAGRKHPSSPGFIPLLLR
jgi:hypothetical protein